MESAQTIQMAFQNLIETKEFEKISILEICKKANVTKKVFYHSFKNKHDIIETQIYDDFVEPAKRYQAILPTYEIKSSTTLLLDKYFATLAEKQDYYQSLLQHYGKAELTDAITKVMAAFDRETFQVFDLPEYELEFIISFFASIGANATIWWLDGHTNSITPKQMSKLVNTWAYANFREFARLNDLLS